MECAAHRILLALAIETALDALVIMMALRILRFRIRPSRVLFAALFAAVAAMAVKGARLTQPIALMTAPAIALSMLQLSGGWECSFRKQMRGTAVMLACSGFLGGTVLALYGATDSLAAAYLLSGAAAAAVFVGVLRAARASAQVRRVRVECVIGGKRLTFEAIIDSGNTLRDYLTHRPVIVASAALQEESMSLRPIFANTAGGRQMMQLVMPQETTLSLENGQIRVKAALAFSPGLDGSAPALVPASLLDEEDKGD